MPDQTDRGTAGELALDGGNAVIPEGPPSWPLADPEVRSALERAYADGSWGRYLGPHTTSLEQRLAELHGGLHVRLCSSGTFAVELALRALNVRPADEVILAGYDFAGNFRSVEAVGARPVLIDIAEDNWCLDVDHLEPAITDQTRAVIVSHLHGGCAPMTEIMRIAQRHGLRVVEDACQAPGAVVEGSPAGTWGDVGVLSFGGSKLLTAGRGGAILTRHADVYQRAKVFCERGNNAFPLSELQAAVLLPQLDKLAQHNRRRREAVDVLRGACRDLAPLRPVPTFDSDAEACYYKLAWLYEPALCGGCSRERFVRAARAEGVALDSGFAGFARRSDRRCRRAGQLEKSQRAAEQAVLLHHPVLLQPPRQVQRVAEALRKIVAALPTGAPREDPRRPEE